MTEYLHPTLAQAYRQAACQVDDKDTHKARVFWIGDSLLDLAADVDEFTRHRVPQERHTPAVKCAAEAAEFAANPCLEEAADVLITVLGWVTSNDHLMETFLDMAHAKMHRNLARTWVQQPDGTWQHVEALVR